MCFVNETYIILFYDAFPAKICIFRTNCEYNAIEKNEHKYKNY